MTHFPFSSDSTSVTGQEAWTTLADAFPDILTEVRHYSSDELPEGYSIRYTYCGSYQGSFVERANAETILEDCPNLPIIKSYDMGGYGLMISCEEPEAPWDIVELEALWDMLTSLMDYPVLDEERLSNLEMAAGEESYDEARGDIIQRLEDELEEDCPPRMEANAEALLTWMENQTSWWDVLSAAQSPEYDTVYTNPDPIVREIMGLLEDGVCPVPRYVMAWWADQRHPEFATQKAFTFRVAASNREQRAELWAQFPGA